MKFAIILVIVESILSRGNAAQNEQRKALNFDLFEESKWFFPIPYQISHEFDDNQSRSIRSAIEEIEQETCVRFTDATGKETETSYAIFTPSDSYFSSKILAPFAL